jgi:CheY-like chemotaxis protein
VDLACGADLLLIDLPPAAGSARDLLRLFWTDPAAASVPVVFLVADRGVPAHAVSTGGADYLARPVDPQLLLSIVAARVASRRALQRLFVPAP